MESRGNRLATILHEPEPAAKPSVALVIVVGGPQYRVGSHRQFVHLARALAARGIIVVRFDYQGMGDSNGPGTDFLNIAPDLAAVVSWLRARRPDLLEIGLWGLCDGATAAVLFGSELPDVTSVCLVNPWVRTEHSVAQARLKYYYLRRIRSRDFWQRIVSGQVKPASLLTDLTMMTKRSISNLMQRKKDSFKVDESNFVEIMRAKLEGFPGRTLVILSSDDLTATEFRIAALDNSSWRQAMRNAQVVTIQADHTFSRRESREEVADVTYQWIANGVATDIKFSHEPLDF